MNDTPNKKSRLQREEPAANPGRTHNRKRRKNGKVLYYLVLVLLLGVLVFSSVKIITYLKDQKNAQASQDNMNNEFVQPTPTPDPDDGEDTDKDKDKDKTEVVSQPEHKGKIDFAAMREKYPDVVGWIYGANTGLDWPIVRDGGGGRRIPPVPRHRRQGQQERYGVPGLALRFRFLHAEQHDLRPQHEDRPDVRAADQV